MDKKPTNAQEAREMTKSMADIKAMFKSGVSAETIHTLHGALIQCTICFEKIQSDYIQS